MNTQNAMRWLARNTYMTASRCSLPCVITPLHLPARPFQVMTAQDSLVQVPPALAAPAPPWDADCSVSCTSCSSVIDSALANIGTDAVAPMITPMLGSSEDP